MTEPMRVQLRVSPKLHEQLVKEAKAEIRSLQSYLHILIEDGRKMRRMDRLAFSPDAGIEEDEF